jgi:hypothetical protein
MLPAVLRGHFLGSSKVLPQTEPLRTADDELREPNPQTPGPPNDDSQLVQHSSGQDSARLSRNKMTHRRPKRGVQGSAMKRKSVLHVRGPFIGNLGSCNFVLL